MSGLIVTVLGAGGSVSCGFPLATNFLAKLQEFAAPLGKDSEKLKFAIDHVVSKAREVGCPTPDDLALRLYQEPGGGVANQRAMLRTLDYARVATDALFLAIEENLSNEALLKHKNYWHQVVGPWHDEYRWKFPSTNHRLLSFNYDRVPEIAFRKFYPAFAGADRPAIYDGEVLNSGLSWGEGADTYAQDRFCYLKLHGSIGIEALGPQDLDWDFGQRFRHYAPLKSPAATTDTMYFQEANDPEGCPETKRRPLVIFPVDKQRIEGGGQFYAVDNYVRAIREQARSVFATADVVRIIGYSFAAPDQQWLISLLRMAPGSAKIRVHNRDPKPICDLLEDEGFANVTPRIETW